MSVAPREASAVTLLATVADPAVIVDASGSVIGWNEAAAALLGITGEPTDRSLEAIAGRRASTAERVALADPAGATLLAWHLDEHGLAPNDIALEKLDTIGRIAGGVRHDLMNPLSAVMGFAELQATDPRLPSDLRELAADVGEAARRIQQMTHTMLEFSRSSPPEPTLLAIGPLMRELTALLTHATVDMAPRVAIPDSLPEIEADRGRMRQAFLALLVNALEAQGTSWSRGARPVPGRLTVTGRAIDDGRGNRLRITIENGGPEVPAEERAALLTGAGPRPGARDLAVARALVEEAGGRVSYEAGPGGNRLVVELPVAGATLPRVPDSEPVVQAGPSLVLVCDADPMIRGLLVRFVTRAGAKAVEARDGREALAIMADQPVVLVIADAGVDGAGAELYDRAVALRPQLAGRFVLVSSDASNAKLAEFTERTGGAVVSKPFDQPRLGQLVREAIEG